MSFWYEENIFDIELFNEIVNEFSNNSVTETLLIDEYFCDKTNRKSKTFRLKYLNLYNIINPDTVMILHYKIGDELTKALKVDIR